MKRNLFLCACATILFATVGSASDLKNKDSAGYEVKISSGASTISTSIEGRTMQSNVCSECEIEVVGVGKIQVTGSEVAVIRDGKLSKQ
jgi:hypothetical protein